MAISTVIGVEKTIKNFTKLGRAVGRAANRGMLQGGLLIQREAQKLVPIDSGNLRASAYTLAAGLFKRPNIPKFTSPSPKGFPRDVVEETYLYWVANKEAKQYVGKNAAVPRARVGFTVSYAKDVHDDLEAAHNVGEAEFLLKSVLRNSPSVQTAVDREVKIELAKPV